MRNGCSVRLEGYLVHSFICLPLHQKSEQIVCGRKNKVCFKNHNLKFGCLFFLMYLCTAIPPIWLSWESNAFVMRRSPVRVRVSAPCGISTSVVYGLPKPGRRVRFPYSAQYRLSSAKRQLTQSCLFFLSERN